MPAVHLVVDGYSQGAKARRRPQRVTHRVCQALPHTLWGHALPENRLNG